jgi:hypothetical protein
MTDILQDEVVRATDLNRASGEVLNKASRTPVTIVRNEETFALMRRDVAAGWRKEATFAAHLTQVMWHALAHPSSMGPEFDWIGAFDEEDRREMVDELMNLYRKAIRDGSWDDLEAGIHEWSESGWAARSSELKKAFDAPDERIPLENARAI